MKWIYLWLRCHDQRVDGYLFHQNCPGLALGLAQDYICGLTRLPGLPPRDRCNMTWLVALMR